MCEHCCPHIEHGHKPPPDTSWLEMEHVTDRGLLTLVLAPAVVALAVIGVVWLVTALL